MEVGVLPDCNVHRSLAYAVQQIITQELEVERLKRASILTGLGRVPWQSLENMTNPGKPESVQNRSNLSNNTKQPRKNVTSLKEIVSLTRFFFYCQCYISMLTISGVQRLFRKYHYE